MRKIILLFVVGFFGMPVWAQIQRSYHYGVVPTENITTVEVNPVLNVLDDSAGVSSSQIVLKTYRVIDENFNWGIELPLARYESPDKSVSGLGDGLFSMAWILPEGGNLFGYGARMEIFVPTATDKRLGAGQLQASPSVFVLKPLGRGFYTALGYKHYVSVVGDHSRDDINLGRLRLYLGYTAPSQWWIVSNLYYYMDYKHSSQAEFIPELEVGTLINTGTAFYINGSTHAAGNWHSKDWSLGMGFKLLYL